MNLDKLRTKLQETEKTFPDEGLLSKIRNGTADPHIMESAEAGEYLDAYNALNSAEKEVLAQMKHAHSPQ